MSHARVPGTVAALAMAAVIAGCNASSSSPQTGSAGTQAPSAIAADYFELEFQPGLAWAPADADQEAEAAAALAELNGEGILTGVAARVLTISGDPAAQALVYSLSPSWADTTDDEDLARSVAHLLDEPLPPSLTIRGHRVWVIPHGNIGVAVWNDGLYLIYLIGGSRDATEWLARVVLLDVELAVDVSPSAEQPHCPSLADAALPHQDSDLEGLLPSVIAGRPLSSWSLTGVCWLRYPNDPEVAAGLESDARDLGVDVDALAYAMAGRSDLGLDPPYSVHVIRAPDDQSTIEFALVVMAGNVGFLDFNEFFDGDYEQQLIAGKQVLVGSEGMLVQDEHQRGLPYVYDAGDWIFIVVTDDEAWALEAIGQLP